MARRCFAGYSNTHNWACAWAEWIGRLVQANEAFCRMVGYSEEELLGRTWMELTHPDDLDTALKNREQLSRDPSGFVDAELRYIHRRGVRFGRASNLTVRLWRQPAYPVAGWRHLSAAGRRMHCARVKIVFASWQTAARRSCG